MRKLTIKERKAVDAFLEHGNKTQAFIDAGYKYSSRSVASSQAHKIFNRPPVVAYLEERMAIIEDEAVAKATEVLKRLTRIARREETEHIVVTTSREDTDWSGNKKITSKREEVEVVEIPSKLNDTNKALELLGKYYALWTDKQEVTVDVPVLFEGEDELAD